MIDGDSRQGDVIHSLQCNVLVFQCLIIVFQATVQMQGKQQADNQYDTDTRPHFSQTGHIMILSLTDRHYLPAVGGYPVVHLTASGNR